MLTVSPSTSKAPRFRILSVTTRGSGSGAERVAWNLYAGYRGRGHASWLAVGGRACDDPGVFEIPNDSTRSAWARLWYSAARPLFPREKAHPWVRRLRLLVSGIGDPARAAAQILGHEDFHYPGTAGLLELTPEPPDVVHAHNLHGGYFDLRRLPRLSHRVALVLTLHDAWLLSGHCAHSFGCERWRTGCGRCPDLSIYPAITRDATASNFRRKRRIYTTSRLFVATPSKWLEERVAGSMLGPAATECRVIPNGVDLGTFAPGDSAEARKTLGLPRDDLILLFAANGILHNRWKDFETIRRAASRVSQALPRRDVLVLALGEDAPPERFGGAEIRFLPYQADHAAVAAYYRSADLYIHAARAETFPNTVLEALACGTPVVATAVGGVVEQVRGLRLAGAVSGPGVHGALDGTGVLVPQGDAEALAAAIAALARDDGLRRRLAQNADRDARTRFDREAQVDAYLEWFHEILNRIAAAPVLGGTDGG